MRRPDDVCDSLEIERAELEGWVEAGLLREGPVSEPWFDAEAVSRWPVEQGLAEAADDEPDLIFATQQEAARWFGVAHDTLAGGWRSRGMPGEPGAYSARKIAQWLAHRYGLGSAENDANGARQAAIVRKLQADAAIKEFRLALRQKKLCNLERVRLLFGEDASRTRDTLLRIPVDLRPCLPREHADDIAAEATARCVRRLACWLREISEALAGPDGEAVGSWIS